MVVAEVCSSMKYPKRCQYKHAKQKKYHVRNWAEYNEGLRRRGDLTVWFDEEAIANWKADKTGKPGGQRVYSDMAIETGLVVRMVYKLAYRQTEGFLHSIASLLGLGIEIPDYSTLCRRSRLLRKKLRIPKAASTQPIHLSFDCTNMAIALLHGGVRILTERRVSLRRNHHARPSSRNCALRWLRRPLPCRMHCPPPPTLEVLESVLAKRGLGLRRELVTPSVRTQQCSLSRDQRRCATCAMRAALAVCGRFQHESSSPCYRSWDPLFTEAVRGLLRDSGVVFLY